MGYGPPSATNGMKEKIPKGYGKASIQQYTPQQMQLHEQQFANVDPNSYLAKLAGGDQSTFDQMEAPAFRQFSELQGGLASRFSGMGGGGSQRSLGGRHSSGFQNTMNSAASNFAQELQGKRQSIQQQALSDLMGYSNQILGQKPYQNELYEKPQKTNGWMGLAGAGLGAVGGFFAGGPAGAFQGAQLGYGAGNAFGGGGGGGGMPNFGGGGGYTDWQDTALKYLPGGV